MKDQPQLREPWIGMQVIATVTEGRVEKGKVYTVRGLALSGNYAWFEELTYANLEHPIKLACNRFQYLDPFQVAVKQVTDEL